MLEVTQTQQSVSDLADVDERLEASTQPEASVKTKPAPPEAKDEKTSEEEGHVLDGDESLESEEGHHVDGDESLESEEGHNVDGDESLESEEGHNVDGDESLESDDSTGKFVSLKN